jgi:hypothetical protein
MSRSAIKAYFFDVFLITFRYHLIIVFVVFYFLFFFSGNLALCGAFNNSRTDKWRNFQSKRTISGY